MKITYIYHSSFCVELEDKVFLFDYFKGELPTFSKDKKIYVFVSHKHQDHYDKCIFNLADVYEQIQFLLPNDMKMNEKYMERIEVPLKARDKIMFLKKNETYQIDSIVTVETLTSTDMGVAFIVTALGKCIYHAGDLNWWTWKGETEQEFKEMTKAFQSEIGKINGRHFDVAFLPLDPRQEERFSLGFDYFMKHTNAEKAIPMHYWEKPEIIDDLLKLDCAKEYREKVIGLRKEGESVEL